MYGICLPAGRDGRGSVQRAIWMTAIALAALVVGAIVTNAAAGGHHLPQPSVPSVPYVVYSVAGSLFSGVVEEMVALAFVVSTLRQARRPAVEIVIVAVLLRCSYHIYYGAGIAGIAVWAAVFAILYLWLRSVIPLIILHFLWDAVQFMGLKWPVVGGLGELAGLLLLLAGFGCGLADLAARNGTKGAAVMYGHQPFPPGAPYPPGVYQQPPSGPVAPYTAYPPPPGPGPFGTYPSGAPYPPPPGPGHPPQPGPGYPPPPGAPYPPQPSPYSQQPPPGYTQAPPGYTQTPPPGGTPPGSDTSAGGTSPGGTPPPGT
jgi:membrane protease YdiL (CAAX protease family)